MTTATGTTTSTTFDHEAWARDGYVLVHGAVGGTDLDALRAEVGRLTDEILADRPGYGEGRYVPLEDEREGYEAAPSGRAPPPPQLRMTEPLVDISPPFARLAGREAVIAPARAALGGDVRLFED